MTIEQALAHIVALETELAGEKKANVLLNAGMGSVCDGRDELKHENRALKAQIAEAVAAERERISKIVKSGIAVYRHNATVVPERKAEFNELAESYAALDALIWNRYEDAR